MGAGEQVMAEAAAPSFVPKTSATLSISRLIYLQWAICRINPTVIRDPRKTPDGQITGKPVAAGIHTYIHTMAAVVLVSCVLITH